MPQEHRYRVDVRWTGNLGSGTSGYRAYSRNHEITAPEKAQPVLGSSDPAFRGDPTRYNPEELFVSALSTCHMLWVLHLCADAGITVTEYSDSPEGTMVTLDDGSGEFIEVLLRPRMSIDNEERIVEAMNLHGEAHAMCFLARSVRCSVRLQPVVGIAGPSAG